MAAPIGDDYFRLAHDDTTGKARLNPRDTGAGLAAALLAELMVEGAVETRAGRVVPCPGARTPPRDAVAHQVLEQVVGDPTRHDVRTWLSVLGATAGDAVGGRLARAGHVRPATVRRRLRQDEVRYVPADSRVAAAPWARLSSNLRRQQAMSQEDTFLAGLVSVTGLAPLVLDEIGPDAWRHLARLVGVLQPALRDLLAHTEVVIGEGVLQYRR